MNDHPTKVNIPPFAMCVLGALDIVRTVPCGTTRGDLMILWIAKYK